MAFPDLDTIAARLEGLEETIILRLIDRAQFCANPTVYQRGRSGFEGGGEPSLFDLRLRYQEEMDALFGRFEVPEERPFTRGLPRPRRRVVPPEPGLAIRDYDAVNLTAGLRSSYFELVPLICRPGDDGQYGSSVEHDVYALQAISRRIHYGAFFVAEAKLRADPHPLRALIGSRDAAALEAALTRAEVERRVMERVHAKVKHIQGRANTKIRVPIAPAVVREFYRTTVIPLTRKGEALYLLRREEPAGKGGG